MTKASPVLRKLGQTFFEANNIPAALLCFDHYYTSPLTFQDLDVYQMADELNTFRLYIQLLLHVHGHPNPVEMAEFSKLFGFQKLSENHVLLSNGSYLHRAYRSVYSSEDIQLYTLEFLAHFRTCIANRLRGRVSEQNNICKTSRTFTPCLTYAVLEFCHRDASCRDAHIRMASFTSPFYNTRIRIHLQQILIVSDLHFVYPYSSDNMISQRK